MRKILFTLFLAGMASAATAGPLWMRYNSISPDGTRIAFAYKGDIYVVSSDGGTAKRLTSSASHETNPIWSNDSETIAFA